MIGRRIVLIPLFFKLYIIVFINGECSFVVENDHGTEYRLTINKKGKVIDEEELE